MKLLIVENDGGLVECFHQLFHFHNSHYKVKYAKTIGEALPLIKSFKPELVFLDYLLDDLGDAEKIYEECECCGCKVILMSASKLGEEFAHSRNVKFLKKPFDFEEFFGCMGS